MKKIALFIFAALVSSIGFAGESLDLNALSSALNKNTTTMVNKPKHNNNIVMVYGGQDLNDKATLAAQITSI